MSLSINISDPSLPLVGEEDIALGLIRFMIAKRSENNKRNPGNARMRALDTGALTAAA